VDWTVLPLHVHLYVWCSSLMLETLYHTNHRKIHYSLAVPFCQPSSTKKKKKKKKNIQYLFILILLIYLLHWYFQQYQCLDIKKHAIHSIHRLE
jgi:hypothetical protein